jgi:hypothetical protein
MRQALVLANFAALGFVFELFVVKEKLFSGCKNKISPAVDAFESLVLEFHERPTSPYVPPALFLMRKSTSFKAPLGSAQRRSEELRLLLKIDKCVTAMNVLYRWKKGKARFTYGLPRFFIPALSGPSCGSVYERGLVSDASFHLASGRKSGA